MTGTRPIIDFMFADFVLDAVGEIINQIAKIQYMSAGRIKMPILLSAFPFQEIAATANYCGTTCGIGNLGAAFSMSPTNVLTSAVAGTTNIDSTELGVFSLDTSLMSATLNPSTIAALAGVTTTFKFLNTSTGLDPNPDYVNQLLLTVPTGAIPNSVTITSPNQTGVTWYANSTGTACGCRARASPT